MNTRCWDFTSPSSEVLPPLWRKDAPLTWAVSDHSCWCRSRCDIYHYWASMVTCSVQKAWLKSCHFLPIILKCHIIKLVRKGWEEETQQGSELTEPLSYRTADWKSAMLWRRCFLFAALTFLLGLSKPVHCFRVQYFARHLSTPPVHAWLRAA